MMRQYELVERVTRYNPNADENLLNKAYVYAMRKHGSQQRANGDPYFSHPLEVAGILTDLLTGTGWMLGKELPSGEWTITREVTDADELADECCQVGCNGVHAIAEVLREL